MCLVGAVVASWSLRQEMTGLNPFTVMTNIFGTEFNEFKENVQRKLKCSDRHQRRRFTLNSLDPHYA